MAKNAHRQHARPVLFKMGNAWVWRCTDHQIAGPVHGVFKTSEWPHAWACALTAAVTHATTFHEHHDGPEGAEEIGEI